MNAGSRRGTERTRLKVLLHNELDNLKRKVTAPDFQRVIPLATAVAEELQKSGGHRRMLREMRLFFEAYRVYAIKADISVFEDILVGLMTALVDHDLGLLESLREEMERFIEKVTQRQTGGRAVEWHAGGQSQGSGGTRRKGGS